MSATNLNQDAAVVALQPEVSKLTAFARSLVIKTAEGYSEAASYLKGIKGMLAKIEEARTRVTKPLLQAQREVNDQAREAALPLQQAETAIKRAMIGYSDEQERLRREEQARADEAARREQEKLQARAEKAAAAGKVEKAAELEVQAATVVAPVIQREAPKVTGIGERLNWKFEIIDPAAVPRNYCTPDEKKIGAVVRGLKGDTQIPGVRVWAEKNIAAGAA